MAPRLTTEELQAAKRRKREQAAAEQQQQEERRRTMEDRIERYLLLASVTQALYEEVSKLATKAPKETLTALGLQKVNDAIRDVKALLPDDPNLQAITIFEPAGDNPEYRDVVLILSLLRAALERFHQQHRNPISLRRL